LAKTLILARCDARNVMEFDHSDLTVLESNRFDYRAAPLALYHRFLASWGLEHLYHHGVVRHHAGGVEAANKALVTGSAGFQMFSGVADAVGGDDRELFESPVFGGLTFPECLLARAMDAYDDRELQDALLENMAFTAAEGLSRMFTETLVAEVIGGEVAPPEVETDEIDVYGPNDETIQVLTTVAESGGATWRSKYGVSEPDEVGFDYYVVVQLHDEEVGTGIVRIDDDYETSAPIQARDA